MKTMKGILIITCILELLQVTRCQDFTCFVCRDAASNAACSQVERCPSNRRSCETTVSVNRGRGVQITKTCKNPTACKQQVDCDKNTCKYCCPERNCNFFDLSDALSGKTVTIPEYQESTTTVSPTSSSVTSAITSTALPAQFSCYHCDKVSTFSDCHNISACDKNHQACLSTVERDKLGIPFLISQRCTDLKNCNDEEIHCVDQMCSVCCTKDKCNEGDVERIILNDAELSKPPPPPDEKHTCKHCQSASDDSECQEEVECPPGLTGCEILVQINNGKMAIYKGCLNMADCGLPGTTCFTPTICSHCCEGTNCNDQDSAALFTPITTRSTTSEKADFQCYSCDKVYDASECLKTTICNTKRGETPACETLVEMKGKDMSFTKGCAQSDKCEQDIGCTGKKCQQCCTGSLCNTGGMDSNLIEALTGDKLSTTHALPQTTTSGSNTISHKCKFCLQATPDSKCTDEVPCASHETACGVIAYKDKGVWNMFKGCSDPANCVMGSHCVGQDLCTYCCVGDNCNNPSAFVLFPVVRDGRGMTSAAPNTGVELSTSSVYTSSQTPDQFTCFYCDKVTNIAECVVKQTCDDDQQACVSTVEKDKFGSTLSISQGCTDHRTCDGEIHCADQTCSICCAKDECNEGDVERLILIFGTTTETPSLPWTTETKRPLLQHTCKSCIHAGDNSQCKAEQDCRSGMTACETLVQMNNGQLEISKGCINVNECATQGTYCFAPTACLHCCEGTNCNDFDPSNIFPPPTTKPKEDFMCYFCDEATDIDDCWDVTTCVGNDQACETIVENKNGELLLSKQCTTHISCDEMMVCTDSVCKQCCKELSCNYGDMDDMLIKAVTAEQPITLPTIQDTTFHVQYATSDYPDTTSLKCKFCLQATPETDCMDEVPCASHESACGVIAYKDQGVWKVFKGCSDPHNCIMGIQCDDNMCSYCCVGDNCNSQSPIELFPLVKEELGLKRTDPSVETQFSTSAIITPSTIISTTPGQFSCFHCNKATDITNCMDVVLCNINQQACVSIVTQNRNGIFLSKGCTNPNTCNDRSECDIDSCRICCTKDKCNDKDTTQLLITGVSTASLPETDVASTSLAETGVASTSLPETGVASTSLPETDIVSTSLPRIDVTSTSLPETDVTSTSLPETDLASTSLPETDLASTSLLRIDVTSTSLPETDVASTSLPRANGASTNVPIDIETNASHPVADGQLTSTPRYRTTSDNQHISSVDPDTTSLKCKFCLQATPETECMDEVPCASHETACGVIAYKDQGVWKVFKGCSDPRNCIMGIQCDDNICTYCCVGDNCNSQNPIELFPLVKEEFAMTTGNEIKLSSQTRSTTTSKQDFLCYACDQALNMGACFSTVTCDGSYQACETIVEKKNKGLVLSKQCTEGAECEQRMVCTGSACKQCCKEPLCNSGEMDMMLIQAVIDGKTPTTPSNLPTTSGESDHMSLTCRFCLQATPESDCLNDVHCAAAETACAVIAYKDNNVWNIFKGCSDPNNCVMGSHCIDENTCTYCCVGDNCNELSPLELFPLVGGKPDTTSFAPHRDPSNLPTTSKGKAEPQSTLDTTAHSTSLEETGPPSTIGNPPTTTVATLAPTSDHHSSPRTRTTLVSKTETDSPSTVLATTEDLSSGLRCRFCTRVTSLSQCTDVEVCDADAGFDICYTRALGIHYGPVIMYYSGCERSNIGLNKRCSLDECVDLCQVSMCNTRNPYFDHPSYKQSSTTTAPSSHVTSSSTNLPSVAPLPVTPPVMTPSPVTPSPVTPPVMTSSSVTPSPVIPSTFISSSATTNLSTNLPVSTTAPEELSPKSRWDTPAMISAIVIAVAFLAGVGAFFAYIHRLQLQNFFSKSFSGNEVAPQSKQVKQQPDPEKAKKKKKRRKSISSNSSSSSSNSSSSSSSSDDEERAKKKKKLKKKKMKKIRNYPPLRGVQYKI